MTDQAMPRLPDERDDRENRFDFDDTNRADHTDHQGEAMQPQTLAPVLADGAYAARRRLDVGRVVLVPLFLVLGLVAIFRIVVLLREQDGPYATLGATTIAGLTGLFYFLMVWAYLRRGPAQATSTVPLALVAAPIATFLPFALPHVATGQAAPAAVMFGHTLLPLGLLWSVWSVRTLDRSLSLVPQARTLVEHGPYRLVRHPLYLGEIVAMLGLAATLGGLVPLLVWGLLVLLQCYRAAQEESLLTTCLPGYEEYRGRTSRVIPGVF